jgi:hypothetical protein
MKWMGYLNNNLQHIASEKPRESPTATETVNPRITLQVGVASKWLPATIEGIETLYICMKSIYYEYTVDGMLQS